MRNVALAGQAESKRDFPHTPPRGIIDAMDAETVRTIADLARKYALIRERHDRGDGLMRLGAIKALRQLAADLDAGADALTPRRRRKR